MLPLRRILNGCRNLFRKEAVEGELDAEVQAFSILKQGLGAAAIGAIVTYGVATAALFILVLLASFLPAYRASRTPPAIALKNE